MSKNVRKVNPIHFLLLPLVISTFITFSEAENISTEL
jgi:hypothetical protein